MPVLGVRYEPRRPTLRVRTSTWPTAEAIDGLSAYFSVRDRDAILGDFDKGHEEDFERLEELLAGPSKAGRPSRMVTDVRGIRRLAAHSPPSRRLR
jgi:hypothetical protein